MSNIALTDDMIESGKKFLMELDSREIEPKTALWFYISGIKEWKLVIAGTEAENDGTDYVYRKIHEIFMELGENLNGLSPKHIALENQEAPVLKLLRLAIRTGPGISNIRFSKNVINGKLIEDAYIYRL